MPYLRTYMLDEVIKLHSIETPKKTYRLSCATWKEVRLLL